MRNLRAKYFILITLTMTLMVCLWLLSKDRMNTGLQDTELAEMPLGWKRKGVTRKERKKTAADKKIYVMAWRYSGQQAAGIQGLASLQCWAGHSGVPMEVVEPVVRRSELTSTFKPDATDSMRLADYFDLRYLNHMSRRAGYAQVIARREFLKKAPKLVIFVRSEVRDSEGGVVWSSSADSTQCYTEGRQNQVMRHALTELQTLGYCVVKVVITEAGKLSHSKMMDILGEWRHTSVPLEGPHGTRAKLQRDWQWKCTVSLLPQPKTAPGCAEI